MDFILALWKSLLDLLFPGHSTVALEAYFRSLPPLPRVDGTTVLAPYRHPVIRSAIWDVKYRGNRAVIELFAEKLLPLLDAERRAFCAAYPDGDCILVPIPSSKKRRRSRGFNQTELLAKAVILKDKNMSFKTFVFGNNVLYRVKDTKAQSTIKDRKTRLENPQGSFGTYPESISKKALYILLDDVLTTGATLSEAKKTLLTAGACTVICAVLAH